MERTWRFSQQEIVEVGGKAGSGQQEGVKEGTGRALAPGRHPAPLGTTPPACIPFAQSAPPCPRRLWMLVLGARCSTCSCQAWAPTRWTSAAAGAICCWRGARATWPSWTGSARGWSAKCRCRGLLLLLLLCCAGEEMLGLADSGRAQNSPKPLCALAPPMPSPAGKGDHPRCQVSAQRAVLCGSPEEVCLHLRQEGD